MVTGFSITSELNAVDFINPMFIEISDDVFKFL